jgi:signal peptidase I
MFLKKAKGLKLWGKVFLITLLVVFFIRVFFVESYTVSSSQMETALFKGDRVLVNKTSYGIRLPMTLLSIPFTFDTFFGLKSYSDLIHLNYHRLFAGDISRNDVVLFNNPLETDKPLDKRSLFLSRCVAVSGDTIEVEGADFFINGKSYIPSPDLLMSFRFPRQEMNSVFSLMEALEIPQRDDKSDSLWVHSKLNRYEVFLINQNLPDSSKLVLSDESLPAYKLVVPSKGMTIGLNNYNIKLYSHIIAEEEEGNVKIENSRIYVDDRIIFSYEFKNNYYWLLSDNVDQATDSRVFGFISEKNIIGKASLIWYSSGEEGLRNNRIFTFVK